MNNLKIFVVSEEDITEKQEHCIDDLEVQCFNQIKPEEAEEFFYAESFATVLAYRNDELVGCAQLFKRRIEFDDEEVELGGIGGICVSKQHRRKGVATKMIRSGLAVLKDKQCDVACLTTTPNLYPLFEKVGFRLMNRKISFEDINGTVRYDEGAMFISVCSKKIYNHIMNSRKTFHYGKGYW